MPINLNTTSLNDNTIQSVNADLSIMADDLVMVDNELVKLANELTFNVLPALQELSELKDTFEGLNTEAGLLTAAFVGLIPEVNTLKDILSSLSVGGSNGETTLDKIDKIVDIFDKLTDGGKNIFDIYKGIKTAFPGRKTKSGDEFEEEETNSGDEGFDIDAGYEGEAWESTLPEVEAVPEAVEGLSALEIGGEIVAAVFAPEVVIGALIVGAGYLAYKAYSSSQNTTEDNNSDNDNSSNLQLQPSQDIDGSSINLSGNSDNATQGYDALSHLNMDDITRDNDYSGVVLDKYNRPVYPLHPNQNFGYNALNNNSQDLQGSQGSQSSPVNTNPCCNKITQTQINNYYIQKVVDSLTINTTNLDGSIDQFGQKLAQSLINAVNDAHVSSQ